MFMNYKPSQSEMYVKPVNAGLKKAPRVKRRCEKGEAEFFYDRIPTARDTSQVFVDSKVTPIKVRKKESAIGENWAVVPKPCVENNFDTLNPDRVVKKCFYLVHRDDHKNCPKSVKCCHSCKRIFSDSDWVIVKTEGEREFTNKQGKQVVYRGNVYVHYLRNCLVEFQQDFSFNMITVLRSTLQLLPPESEQKFSDKGCTIEEE